MWLIFCTCSAVLVAVSALQDATFPPGFKFGAASAAYQVEGAWNHSDKGESIWDRWTHKHPERILEEATGDVACDSFHQWRTDVDLVAELGVHFYRFSISWPRLLPTGMSDLVSESGLKYYNDLIDGLLEKGVEPVVTLYHFDLPQSLQDLGGWTNPLIVDWWFADYARVVFSLFGSRVKTWITINEPLLLCDASYGSRILAPGTNSPDIAALLCAKNVLLAHATAWRIYDQEFRHAYHGKVSLSNHIVWYEPATNSIEDKNATELVLQFAIGRFSEAIYGKGGWPDIIETLVHEHSKQEGYSTSRLPKFTQAEIDLIKGTFDFYGLNLYTSRTVRAGPRPSWEEFTLWPFSNWGELPAELGVRPEWPNGENAWLNVYPDGLRKTLVWLKERYGDIPMLITENGYPTHNMGLEDDARVDYYHRHLQAVLTAIKEDGVNVTGYTAWTLLDNFEWADGYTVKFGLYEVDFNDPQRRRTARKSARFYADLIKRNSLQKDEL